MELYLSLRKHNSSAFHWIHSKEWLKRNFSQQNHNILKQKHDEGELNGCNQLWVTNNFITWLTYQYFIVISKEKIYYLSNAFTLIPCYWVLPCWAVKTQKKTKWDRGMGIWDEWATMSVWNFTLLQSYLSCIIRLQQMKLNAMIIRIIANSF